MASIDKTYVNKRQFLEAVKWCKEQGVASLENGYKFRPYNMCFGYHDLKEIEDTPDDSNRVFVLWNTPAWYDRWLWLNCPLDFIRKRLQYQYEDEGIKRLENWKYTDIKKNPLYGKQKYTFLREPNFRGKWYCLTRTRKRLKWTKLPYHDFSPDNININISVPHNEDGSWRYFYYDYFDDTWNEHQYLPIDWNGCDWNYWHKNPPTKKSILRHLRKWVLPKGTIVTISTVWVGVRWKILVK